MQILPSRASQTHTQVCRTEVEMRGADGDLWERVRPPLGGAEGAAERDMLGVLAAPPTLTSPFSPAPTPNLGLDCTALGAGVAQQGEPFLVHGMDSSP